MNRAFGLRVFSGLFFLIGLVVIATAWGFQIIGGYQPCALCLEQRTPYYVALPLALCAILISLCFRNQLIAKMFLFLAGITMIYGAGLGVYHAGVEWSFWEGPSECSGGSAVVDNASDLKAILQNNKVINCNEVSWRMLGLSFAGWNVIASVALAIVALIGLNTVSERKRTDSEDR